MAPKRDKKILDLEYSEAILKEIRDREEAEKSKEPLALEGTENNEDTEDKKEIDGVKQLENGIIESKPDQGESVQLNGAAIEPSNIEENKDDKNQIESPPDKNLQDSLHQTDSNISPPATD